MAPRSLLSLSLALALALAAAPLTLAQPLSSAPSFLLQSSQQYHPHQIASSSSSSSSSSFPHPQFKLSPSSDLDSEEYWAAEEGVGHFSEWVKQTKRDFIGAVKNGTAQNWTIVMGNEGGDLDSMTAALTWAYHISHAGHDEGRGESAVALLQTPEDALDLRPENKLALHNAKMSPGHRDLLTIDELPVKPQELGPMIRGIALVDHNMPLSVWRTSKVLSLIDHHHDRGNFSDAKPRVIEQVASCSTLVAREVLDNLDQHPHHMPHELPEMLLSVIALDSDGLRKGTEADEQTAKRLLKISTWKKEDLEEVMDRLDQEMGDAKKDLDDLSVRDLLRRDWKGDVVDTVSETEPSVHLGFASIPVSLSDQIERTLQNTTKDWFDTESAWTAEIGADISIALNSFKIRSETDDGEKKKQKFREIVLVVRADKRIDERQADSLFETVSRAIEGSEELDVWPWERVKELGKRQMVWTHTRSDGGRKIVRPIVERAVEQWKL